MTALNPGAAPRRNGPSQPVGRPRNSSVKTPAAESLAELMVGCTLLSIPQTAKQLGCSTHTLARWARDGQGPRAVVLRGRRKGYLLSELERWLLAHQRGGGGGGP
jgi:predicted DNA-binding transcriptional regulator AlpA